MVFQQFNLFGRKTALENVKEGLIVVKGGLIRPRSNENCSRRTGKRSAYRIVKITILVTSQVDKTTGGFGPCLGHETRGSLLDEPTSALIQNWLEKLKIHLPMQQNQDKTMVLVSHDISFVAQVADKVLFWIKDGLLTLEHQRKSCNIKRRTDKRILC